jgi:hypothetical protein
MRVWIKVVTVGAGLAGLAAMGVGLSAWLRPEAVAPILGALPWLLAGAGLLFMGALFSGLGTMLLKLEANTHRIHELLIESRKSAEAHDRMLGTIRDNSLISDAAKSITHREYERDALRKAIREDILKEDWEAAYSLIEEMETRFGYRMEAYNYRKEVDEFRARAVEDKVQASLRHVQRLLKDRLWDNAGAEVQRLARLVPRDPRVEELATLLQNRREAHKSDLLERWRDATAKKDVDFAIQLLRELDPLLTREEAAELEDAARGLFKDKLVELGVQFKAAISDKRWQDAVGLGETIRREFPNSLMAKEVGETMDALRSKAEAAAVP